MNEEHLNLDTFCLEDACISARNAFFKFDTQNHHISEGHRVESIHPVTFLRIFKNSHGLAQNQRLQTLADISSLVKSAVEEIASWIQVRYFDCYLKKAKQFLQRTGPMTLQKFIKEMEGGNYEMLEQIKGLEKGIGFNYRQKEAQKFVSRFSLEVETTKNQILQYLQKFTFGATHIEKASLLRSQPPGNQEYYSSKQPVPNESYPSIDSIPAPVKGQHDHLPTSLIKTEDNPFVKVQTPGSHELVGGYWKKKLQAKQICLVSDSEDDRDKPKSCHLAKTKPIQKAEKGPQKKKMPASDDVIEQVETSQLIVKEVHSASGFLAKLNQNREIRSIHLFQSKLVSKAAVKKIFLTYPRLEAISFNCNLDIKVLSEFTAQMLKGMKRVCLRWDLERFHQEYFIHKYFRDRPLELLKFQTNKEKDTVAQFLNQIKSNSHQWLFRPIQINDPLLSSHLNPITSLEIEQDLLKYPGLKVISTLKCLTVKGEQGEETRHRVISPQSSSQASFKELATFINQNKGLEIVLFENFRALSVLAGKGISESHNVELVYQELALLPKLVCFSLIHNKQQPLQICADQLNRLPNLQSLSLHNVIFCTQTESQRHAAVIFLTNFSRLRHLSLYKCQFITSSQINHLHESCLAQIKFLNLGQTGVDEKCLGTLAQMQQLQYLNIQKTVLRGKHLVEMLEKFKELFQKKHPLKYLNIKTKIFQWKVKAFLIAEKLKKDQMQAPSLKGQPAAQSQPLVNSTQLTLKSQVTQSSGIESPLSYKEDKQDSMSGQVKAQWRGIESRVQLGGASNTEKALMLIYQRHIDPELKKVSEKEKRQSQIFQNLFKSADLVNISSHVPGLQYLNIGNNFDLANSDLRGFSSLRVLAKDSFVVWSGKIGERVRVYYQSEPSLPPQ